jgi:hypothetical protein
MRPVEHKPQAPPPPATPSPSDSLAAPPPTLPAGEALFRQHVRLKEADDPGSPDLAVTLLQLATYYYANDMLQDAGPVCQQAGVLMRGHFPEDHDLVGGGV